MTLHALSLQKKLHWILKISSGFCFIGHGIFGLITKAEWLPFFSVVSIPAEPAFQLMPLIGLMDILLGSLILVKPRRWILIYMIFWAVWTALLRPLAGMGWWEFLERAGNYGAPFAFLLLSGFSWDWKSWVPPIEEPPLNEATTKTMAFYLRLFTALLMIGHGGFGAFQQKEMLVNHFQSIGFTFSIMDPITFITCFGWIEILIGTAVLIKPFPKLLIFIVVWKILTELLYPVSGAPVWEFVERFGSYGVPLSLFFILKDKQKRAPSQ